MSVDVERADEWGHDPLAYLVDHELERAELGNAQRRGEAHEGTHDLTGHRDAEIRERRRLASERMTKRHPGERRGELLRQKRHVQRHDRRRGGLHPRPVPHCHVFVLPVRATAGCCVQGRGSNRSDCHSSDEVKARPRGQIFLRCVRRQSAITERRPFRALRAMSGGPVAGRRPRWRRRRRQGVGGDGGTMGGRDGSDDGESEPVSVLVMCARPRIEPLEGLEEAIDFAGGMTGPVLVTDSTASPSLAPVTTSTRPSTTLWRTALVSRLATSRSTSRGSPSRGAGVVTASTWIPQSVDLGLEVSRGSQ